jgi:predicted alpha/beta superfamily hydrolase
MSTNPTAVNRRRFFRATIPASLFIAYERLAVSQEYNPGYELGQKTYVSVRSSVLNETRTAEVIVPSDVTSDPENRYEAIYILDGIRAYHYVAYDYLRGEGFIPKRTILVGLLGPKDAPTRLRDFTPTKVSSDTGGADRYLAFLKEELLPAINKKYRTDADRSTLVGGSLGGLFTIHAFLNTPTLFKSYVALDPSLWWDHGVMNTQARRKIGDTKGLHRVLWLNGREGDAMREMRIDQLKTTLQAEAPGDLAWMCRQYPDETHLSTWIKGFWDGIKFCYGGYYANGIGFKPMNGVVVKDRPFYLWCYQRNASSYIRYTINGTEPTLQSPHFLPQNRLSLSKDAELTIKAFCVREQYNAVATGSFKLGQPLQGINRLEDRVKPGGLRFSYYEGEWDTPPDLSARTPDRAGRTDRNFDIGKLPSNATFVCVLEGFLKIDAPGYYIVELSDSGQSKVYVGDVQVIGDHFDSNGANFVLPLSKGFHFFRAVYFHKKLGPELAPVYIKHEAEDDMPIPLENLYSPI